MNINERYIKKDDKHKEPNEPPGNIVQNKNKTKSSESLPLTAAKHQF